MNPSSSLEDPPERSAGRSERRWAFTSLGLLAVVAIGASWTVYRLSRHPLLTSAKADLDSLPESVRHEALALLEAHLEGAQLMESKEGGHCEFLIRGRPKAALAQDFHRAFRPLVVDQLMPLLRPYGESLSFDVTSLDLPPVRLRPFSESHKE